MNIKKIAKKIIGKKNISKCRHALNVYRNKNNIMTFKDKISCILFLAPKIKVYDNSNFSKIVNKDILYNNYFSYFIDFKSFVISDNNLNHNMTPDYSVILENSLEDFRKMYKKNKSQLDFIDELENYLNKYISYISQSNYDNKYFIIENLQNIKNKKCTKFIEALQRILFYNQLFWQMGYTLCGLGRLDFILDKYYKKDIKNNVLNKEEINDIIISFYELLNHHYNEKSGCLYGDTGQIIILGGINNKGNNFENDLTYKFIEVLKEFNKPDPKILLRVNKNTKDELLKSAFDCITTGIGSPLLSNDDIIIPLMIDFGYSKKDVWNYVTAACWEPSPCGNSIDYNNIATINLLKPFNDIDFNNNFEQYEELEKQYYIKLSEYIKNELLKINDYKYADQKYYSLFIKDCRDKGKTLSEIFPKYKNLGVTTLGISSVVNALLNIKKFVYEKKIYNLEQLNKERKSDFINSEVLNMLKQNNKNGYGSNNKGAIELTNKIVKFISKEFNKYNNIYGGKYKFGLSAPSYVENGLLTEASFDGRRNGQPFNTHISSNSNSFIEIIDFASNINYTSNCINGNVIDFFITPQYINNNKDKFINYIKSYINKGFYQMQINVIDSKTLLLAKENPELYKNLIVRVWGFSAYYNDLPEEYKNLLIERAKIAEGLNE